MSASESHGKTYKLLDAEARKDGGLPGEILLPISAALGKDWKNLGRAMNMTEWTLDAIEVDNRTYGVQEMAYKMLIEWKETVGHKATLNALSQYLAAINRTDVLLTSSVPLTGWCNAEQIPVLSSLETPLTLEQLQINLRRRYKMFQMKGLPWMENAVLSLERHFVQLELLQENSDATLKLELKNIFQVNSPNGEESSRILVEGDPGFGKTTLAIKLCYDFGYQKDYIRHFDLVFFFSLRNFSGNVDDMICNAAFITHRQRTNLFEIISRKSVKTLLVLDGYDELPNKHVDSIQGLIRGELLPHFTLLVTARSGKYSSKATRVSKHFLNISSDVGLNENQIWDKCAKIIGISPDRQDEFLERHLSSFPTTERKYIDDQLTLIKGNKVLTADFLQCPLFFLMIILLLTEKNTDLRHVRTKTELYKGVLNFVMRRYFTKCSVSCAAQGDLFSLDVARRSDCSDLLIQLGKMSLAAIKDGRLSFSSNDVLECDERILDLGILTQTVSVKGLQEVECYEPVHKSLIEFAASYFLWVVFRTGRRDLWEENICSLRPTFATHKSSLVFPFLAGLMGKEAAAMFDTLNPYTSEYSSIFDSVIPTLCEVEITNSLLPSIIPFVPASWYTYWFRSSISSAALPPQILSEGLKQRKVQEIKWDLDYPICFDSDVKVDKIVLYADSERPRFSKGHYKRVECRSLVCEFVYLGTLENKWADFLSLFSLIQFEHISFIFSDDAYAVHFIPLIYDAAINGELKHAEIHLISCVLTDENSTLMDMLIRLIETNRVRALYISIYFLPSPHKHDALLRSMSNSSRLTRFRLSYVNETQPLTVDLTQLFNEGQKSYEWLDFDNVKLECNLENRNDNFQIHLLELPRVENTTCVSSLLHSCRVASLYGHCSVMICDSNLFHESLTNLNIIIDETFFQQELFSQISKFRNLQVLTLSMMTFKYHLKSVENWLSNSADYLLHLKGIEFDEIESNLPLATDILGSFSKHLDKYSCASSFEINVSHPFELKECLLQYLWLNCDVDPDVNDPSSSDALIIQEFLCLVASFKQSLLRKSLPRLDIVILNFSFLEYLLKFKPNGVSSFVDLFPPNENFVVYHDRLGMRDDDSIQSKMWFDIIYAQPHRFSVSFRA